MVVMERETENETRNENESRLMRSRTSECEEGIENKNEQKN